MPSIKQAAAAFLANQRIAVTGSLRQSPRATAATSSTSGCATAAMRSSRSTPTPTPLRATCYKDLRSIPAVQAVVIGTRPELAEDTMHQCARARHQTGVDASGPWRRQRLGRCHRLRPPARHHSIDGGCR